MTLKINLKEFIALMALLMSLPALAIDTVLPALPLMKEQLNVTADNHIQFVISFLFIGLMFGQLFFGPFADSYGRKTGLIVGLSIFIAGCIVSLVAPDIYWMLAGRLLQGAGAASARVICLAIARDLYQGRDMARIMSFVMAVFIFVPVIAPTLGQGILQVADWRTIFGVYIITALIAMFWMYSRLSETLAPKARKPFEWGVVLAGFGIVLRHKTTLLYTICTGLIFGGFTGYLLSAQQIFQNFYDVGDMFPIYFGISALSIGVASSINGMIVKRVGIRLICHYSLIVLILASGGFLLLFDLSDPELPLLYYMVFIAVIFFCQGMLYGNLNALAMEPMGARAGTASAVIGSLSTAIAVAIGSLIGQLYDHTLTPLFAGFFCMSVMTFCLLTLFGKRQTLK